LNKSNRSSCGLSLETIEDFSKNLSTNLRIIRKKFKKGYKFEAVKGVVISKASSSGKIKLRGIRVAEVADRVAQRAITRIIEPLLEKKFNLRNEASFAYLKRRKSTDETRSVQTALMRMIQLYEGNRPWVFEADIVKFFDTVDRKKLLEEKIFPSLPDSSINSLIEDALSQEVITLSSDERTDWDALFPEGGIPQGGGLSPLLANVCLSDLDAQMLKDGFGLIRYADDFIVLCETREKAVEAQTLAEKVLKELNLQLHSEKTDILKITQNKFSFLGVRYNGQRIWPDEEKLSSFKKNILEITEFKPYKNLLDVLKSLKYAVEGWIAAYSFSDLAPYLPVVEDLIRTRLGVCASRMGWNGAKNILSSRARSFSGIRSLFEFLARQRANLSEKEAEVFKIKYSIVPPEKAKSQETHMPAHE